MRRDVRLVVEGILRDYPRLCASMRERERYLEALSHNMAENGGGGGGGGSVSSEQERLMLSKERDAEFQALLAAVEGIGQSVMSLLRLRRLIIQQIYFLNRSISAVCRALYISRSTAWREKSAALNDLKPRCLSLSLFVEEWREREKERRFEAVRSVM